MGLFFLYDNVSAGSYLPFLGGFLILISCLCHSDSGSHLKETVSDPSLCTRSSGPLVSFRVYDWSWFIFSFVGSIRLVISVLSCEWSCY